MGNALQRSGRRQLADLEEQHDASPDAEVDAIVDELLTNHADALTARLRLPRAEDLEVDLVPLALVRRLDELRSAASAWVGAATLATSVPAGIAINWLTDSHPDPTVAAIVVLSVFGSIAIVAWCLAAAALRRARNQRAVLLRVTGR